MRVCSGRTRCTEPSTGETRFLGRSSTMLFASIRFWLAARKKLGPIQASEPLARFLTSSSHYSPGRVRQAAFLPPADLKLSVFRTSEMEEADIWTLGHNHVERPSGRHLHGRAQLTP